MTWNVGIYGTEDVAKDAAARLTKAGFRERKALFASRVVGSEESAIRSLSKEANLPDAEVGECVKHLREGKSLVAVRPTERAPEAAQILQEGALQTLQMTPTLAEQVLPGKSNAAPFSGWLGMRVLAKSAPSTDIQLSNEPAPLSSRLKLNVLSKSRPAARLMNDPAPFSSLLGREPLTKSAPTWDIQLKDDPAPLASRLSLRPLGRSGPTGDIQLSKNPAPFSSMLGLPTLIKRER